MSDVQVEFSLLMEDSGLSHVFVGLSCFCLFYIYFSVFIIDKNAI